MNGDGLPCENFFEINLKGICDSQQGVECRISLLVFDVANHLIRNPCRLGHRRLHHISENISKPQSIERPVMTVPSLPVYSTREQAATGI